MPSIKLSTVYFLDNGFNNIIIYCTWTHSQWLSELFRQKKSDPKVALLSLDFEIVHIFFGFGETKIGFHAVDLDGFNNFALAF